MTTTPTIIAPRPTAQQQLEAAVAVELIEKRAAEHRLEKDERPRKLEKVMKKLEQTTGYADGDMIDGLPSLGRIEGTATVERCLSKALTGCEGSARDKMFRGMEYRTGIDVKEKILTIAYANPEVPEGVTVQEFINTKCPSQPDYEELLDFVITIDPTLEKKVKEEIRFIKRTLRMAFSRLWNESQVDRNTSNNGLVSRNFMGEALAASSSLNYRLNKNHDEAMSSKAASRAEREAAENWQLRSA